MAAVAVDDVDTAVAEADVGAAESAETWVPDALNLRAGRNWAEDPANADGVGRLAELVEALESSEGYSIRDGVEVANQDANGAGTQYANVMIGAGDDPDDPEYLGRGEARPTTGSGWAWAGTTTTPTPSCTTSTAWRRS